MGNSELLEKMESAVKNNKFNEYDKLRDGIGKAKYEEIKDEIEEIFKKYNSVHNYFKESLSILLNLHKLSSSANHSTIIGNTREAFVKNFLKNILPTDVEYKTGQTVNIRGRLSNQLDIILQKSSSPKLSLDGDSQICFYEAIMAVIEIKSNLKNTELDKALNQFKVLGEFQIENRFYSGRGNRYREIKGESGYSKKLGIPCFLIGYTGITKETLKKSLKEYAQQKDEIYGCDFENFLPEVIVNLERKYVFVRNDGVLNRKDNDELYVIIENDLILSDLFLYLCKVFESYKEILLTESYFNKK